MFFNDIDSFFLKSINFLYSSDSLKPSDPVPLQFCLEEAIQQKSGVTKDLSGLVTQALSQKPVAEVKHYVNPVEESKGSSSDNELELDLFQEDLMCIVCNGMDVGARNRLLECSDCHVLYHQECHVPIVTNQDSFDLWVCQSCKDRKKVKQPVNMSPAPSTQSKISSSASSSSSTSSTKSNSSSSQRHSSNSSYKSGSKGDKSKYSKGSSKSSSSKSSNRSTVTPTINIISAVADKRIQSMKKKAAKHQEKRKHLSR